MKKILLIPIFLMAIVLAVSIGVLIDRKVNSAAIYPSLFTHTECVNQKCVVSKTPGPDNCSTDTNCFSR